MTQKYSKEWIQTFREFLKVDEIVPPQHISEAILSRVHGELNPRFGVVLAKLFFLHALMALAITLICPQLGVGPIFDFYGLHDFFMRFGPLPCAALCGALFLGATALISVIVLRVEELRLANKYRFINISFLAAISFSGLMIAGGEADRLSYAFWMAGAVLAGWMILGVGTKLRLSPVFSHFAGS